MQKQINTYKFNKKFAFIEDLNIKKLIKKTYIRLYDKPIN